ncbi:MAG: hypothetical protein SFX73_26485 [Kofleriaceae bacterium]|nr:hypothetical protein [Kofleriaceae bacterium]
MHHRTFATLLLATFTSLRPLAAEPHAVDAPTELRLPAGIELSASATATTFATTGNTGATAAAAWNLPSLRLGASVTAVRGDGYLAGYQVDELQTLGATASAYWRAQGQDGVRFEAGGAVGARVLAASAAMAGGDDRGLVVGGELEARAVFGRGRVRGVLGIALPLWVAVRPSVEPDELSQLTRGGVEIAVGKDLWATAMAEVGGAFGYDGDGAKFRAGAQVGVKWMPTASRSGGPSARGSIGAYLATEWRAFGLAGHASHGPGLSAGVTLFGGGLKLGILAHGRPGPINPTTFDTMPVDGQTYRGKSSLPLRSDGNFIGLVAAPVFRAGPLRIELPLAVGQAAYGFFLAGEDRNTPDGRRVSEWENELFAGKDSSFAIGAEAGVVVAVPVRSWLEPYVAARYSVTVGYDSIVRDSYSGPSLGLGLQVRP